MLNIKWFCKTELPWLKKEIIFILYGEWSLAPCCVCLFSVHAKIGSEKFIHSFCFCRGRPLLRCSMAMPLTLFGEKILNQNSSVFKIIFISVAYIPHIFPIMISLLLRNVICWIFRLNFSPSSVFKMSCPGLLSL